MIRCEFLHSCEPRESDHSLSNALSVVGKFFMTETEKTASFGLDKGVCCFAENRYQERGRK